MIIQATNFTVMLLAFLCIDTLSQKKKNGSNHVRIAKIYITCSSLFDQTSKKTHVSVIHVKNGNLNHTNVHNFLFPFSRLNVYAV